MGHGTSTAQRSFDDLGTPLIDTTFAVLDLETTGLRPREDRITEIGAVRVCGGEVDAEFSTFVHPGRTIPPAITALTGISDAMVRNAPRIDDVLERLAHFLHGAVFVAHNARFDHAFLAAAFARHGFAEFAPVIVDTARLARRLLGNEVRNVRLATLATYLGARTPPSHRALTDARATVDVLHALLERAGSLGATTLEDLRELTASRSDRRFRRISLVRDAPRTCGVYQFEGHDGEVLYVGKATDLRARLRSYFGQDQRNGIDQLVRETQRVRWTATPTVLDAEIHELRAIQHHQPRFNRASTRPLAPVYVAVTDETFPRLSVVRQTRAHHRLVVGPVASRAQAQRAIDALEAVIGIRTCRMRLRRAQDHPACLLKSLGRCTAPCDGSQSIADYARVVATLESAIEDPSTVFAQLRERMTSFAAERRFEQATQTRSQVHALAAVLDRHRRVRQLHDAGRLVVAWDGPDHREVVILDRGTYVTSTRIERGAAATLPLPFADASPSEPPHDPIAETGLVLRALARPGARILSVDRAVTSTLAGGRPIAEHVAEARRVARAVRTDRRSFEAA